MLHEEVPYFLDEVGDIPLSLQVKLLRLIETGTYRAVGGVELKHADFRLVCATHQNLADKVEAGLFPSRSILSNQFHFPFLFHH